MNLIILFCTFIFCVYLLYTLKDLYRFHFSIKYHNMLTYFMEKSYIVIYKNTIVTFSSEGSKLPDDVLETVRREFVKHTLMLMGSKNEKDLIYYFGDKITLVTNILDFLDSKLISDPLLISTRESLLTKQD